MLKRIKYISEELKKVAIMSQNSNEAWAVENGYSKDLYEVVQGHDGSWYLSGFAPAPLSMAEQASKLSMTKAEFLILVTGLTKSFPTPITLEAIEALLASNADIRMRFSYANTVERNHPMLDGVSAGFGVAPELLDIMFINKDDLIYKIDNNLPLE